MAVLHQAHDPHAAVDRHAVHRLLDLEGGIMAGSGGIAGRLYRGEVSINFVGRQRTWYTVSGLIVLVSVIALFVLGLNFSLDFTGGSSFTFPADSSANQNAISRVVTATGGGDSTV